MFGWWWFRLRRVSVQISILATFRSFYQLSCGAQSSCWCLGSGIGIETESMWYTRGVPNEYTTHSPGVNRFHCEVKQLWDMLRGTYKIYHKSQVKQTRHNVDVRRILFCNIYFYHQLKVQQRYLVRMKFESICNSHLLLIRIYPAVAFYLQL